MKLTPKLSFSILAITALHFIFFMAQTSPSLPSTLLSVGLTFLGASVLIAVRNQSQTSITLLLTCFALLTAMLYRSERTNWETLAMPDFFLLSWLLYRVHSPMNSNQFISVFNKKTIAIASFNCVFFYFIFNVLPKVSVELFAPQKEAVTGFGDGLEINPGKVAELESSPELAFRVRFSGQHPNTQQLYWRGSTLTETSDGLHWYRLQSPKQSQSTQSQTNENLPYQILLEPRFGETTFVLDQHFGGTSGPNQTSPDRPLSPEDLKQFLITPPIDDARVEQLAQVLRSLSSEDEVQKFLRNFYRSEFQYSNHPGKLAKNSFAEFLFRTKNGFCEHFAASYATLARFAGIPARVIIGFQGGDWNPISHSLSVRDWDAHAWVETWSKTQNRWISIDPNRFLNTQAKPRGINRAGLLWGAFSDLWRFFWEDLSLETKRPVAGSFIRHFIFGLLAALFIMTFLVLFYFSKKIRNSANSDQLISRIYRKYCLHLSSMGIERKENEGPVDFLERSVVSLPGLQKILKDFTDLYVSLKYGHTPVSKDSTAQLSKILKSLMRQKSDFS